MRHICQYIFIIIRAKRRFFYSKGFIFLFVKQNIPSKEGKKSAQGPKPRQDIACIFVPRYCRVYTMPASKRSHGIFGDNAAGHGVSVCGFVLGRADFSRAAGRSFGLFDFALLLGYTGLYHCIFFNAEAKEIQKHGSGTLFVFYRRSFYVVSCGLF